MAALLKTAKPSKVAGRDFSRPILCRGEIVHRDGSAYLCVTDSYKAARIPVGSADEVDAGAVSNEALKALDKVDTFEANGTVDVEVRGVGPVSFQRSDNGEGARSAGSLDGAFPSIDNLFPTVDAGDTVSVGLNAKYLLELAQGMGSDEVRITFERDRFEKGPMVVTPLKSTTNTADGLLMPIRINNGDYGV